MRKLFNKTVLALAGMMVGSAAMASTFTMTVDNPSNVVAVDPSTYADFTLLEGTHEYDVPEGGEILMATSGDDFSRPLYKVTVDGVSVQLNTEDYWYHVYVTEGCHVDVQTVGSADETFDVNFTYSEGAEGFWSIVQVDGRDVADFDGAHLTIPAGAWLDLSGDDFFYDLKKVMVNGEERELSYGYLTLMVDKAMEIHVDANKIPTVSCTLYVDKPENIKVYLGSYYTDRLATGLLGGNEPNVIEVPKSEGTIEIMAAAGCQITKMVDEDGYRIDGMPYKIYNGAEIYIETSEIELPNTAVLYLDGMEGVSYYSCYLNIGADRKSINIEPGYNIINFSDENNSLFLNWFSGNTDLCYVNGRKQNGFYGNPSNYQIFLKQNDVVKTFLCGAPESVYVTVKADMEDAEGVSVTRDVLTPVAGWENLDEEVFANTLYTFSGEGIKVTLNGEELYAEGNVVKAMVTEPFNDFVVTRVESGVSSVNAAAAGDVYNMQGVRVGGRADIATLPAGIYVMNGKKIIKK